MVLERPPLMQPVTGDAALIYQARQLRAGMMGALFSREGVRDKDGGDLRVTQRGAGANMSVDIALGRGAIFGDDASDQGTYPVNSTATENRAIPAASTSATRTHRVIARVRDKSENAAVGNNYDWVIEVQADTLPAAALPPTAIPLASVAVPANASSVTNAMITDLRPRSSIGTPWLVGSMLETGIHSAYGGRDQTRPLTWTKNPDGWVFLSGFIRRTAATVTAAAGTVYPFDGGPSGGGGTSPMLPPDARPTGIRDVPMTTDNGPCNLAIYPNGSMSFRFKYAEPLTANQTWFSFDSIVFRASAFS